MVNRRCEPSECAHVTSKSFCILLYIFAAPYSLKRLDSLIIKTILINWSPIHRKLKAVHAQRDALMTTSLNLAYLNLASSIIICENCANYMLVYCIWLIKLSRNWEIISGQLYTRLTLWKPWFGPRVQRSMLLLWPTALMSIYFFASFIVSNEVPVLNRDIWRNCFVF